MNHISIPETVNCQPCRQCGSVPVIALAEKGEYIVKCPGNDLHYQTLPGLIDIEDWNLNNSPVQQIDFGHVTTIAC